jgi:hypothetical protein
MIVLPVLPGNVGEGLDGVDRTLLEMAPAYRLSGLDRFRPGLGQGPSLLPLRLLATQIADPDRARNPKPRSEIARGGGGSQSPPPLSTFG